MIAETKHIIQYNLVHFDFTRPRGKSTNYRNVELSGIPSKRPANANYINIFSLLNESANAVSILPSAEIPVLVISWMISFRSSEVLATSYTAGPRHASSYDTFLTCAHILTIFFAKALVTNRSSLHRDLSSTHPQQLCLFNEPKWNYRLPQQL